MRKSLIVAAAAGSLALGGCTSGLGGYGGLGGGVDPLGAILGSVIGAGTSGYGGYGGYGGSQSLQNAAVNACGSQASQYGRVNITNVGAVSSNTLQVNGTVDVNGGFDRRGFVCNFRSDGRITGFDIR